jgi:hypothetical protein
MADILVKNPDDRGVVERYVDQGDGSWAKRVVAQAAATVAGSGGSMFRVISGATVFSGSAKGSTATLLGYQFTNNSAAAKFVKFYNKATAPVVGTDVPVMTLQVPAGASVVATLPGGLAFSAGLGIGASGAVTDADTTALAAFDIVGTVFFQ